MNDNEINDNNQNIDSVNNPVPQEQPVQPVQPVPMQPEQMVQPVQPMPMQPEQQPQPQQFQQAPMPPYNGQPQQFQQVPMPQYQQNPYQAPQAPQAEANAKSPAQVFCILSLIFMILSVSGVTGLPFLGTVFTTNTSYDEVPTIYSILSGIWGLFTPASIIMMIIARVKDKKSVFAKVLMWIWIGLISLGIIAIVLVILFTVWLCSQCAN